MKKYSLDTLREQGLVKETECPRSNSRTGYGDKIPTQYMVFVGNKWRRVYCRIYSNISYNVNVVDNWHELNECFDLFESMDNKQKVLFAYVLCEYSYSYDLPTLVNYCLEDACIFEGSARDYAYELIEECYNVKSMCYLANYIDYAAFARDMLLNSEIIELGYNLFWTNPGDI